MSGVSRRESPHQEDCFPGDAAAAANEKRCGGKLRYKNGPGVWLSHSRDAALGLLYAVEPVLTFIPGVGDYVQRYGLGGVSGGASSSTGFQSDVEILGQLPAT